MKNQRKSVQSAKSVVYYLPQKNPHIFLLVQYHRNVIANGRGELITHIICQNGKSTVISVHHYRHLNPLDGYHQKR